MKAEENDSFLDSLKPGQKFFKVGRRADTIESYYFVARHPMEGVYRERYVICLSGSDVGRGVSVDIEGKVLLTTDYDVARERFLIEAEDNLRTIKEIYGKELSSTTP